MYYRLEGVFFFFGILTNPLQLFTVSVTQLILQNSKQIGNDVESFRQEADSLVHFEIAPNRLIDGLELGLDPE